MGILNLITFGALFFIGLLAGSVVIWIAELIGVSIWLVGPVFCGLVLAFIYLNDRLSGFWMRHMVGFLAKREETELSDVTLDDVETSHTRRVDYYGFVAGAVVGVLIGIFVSPTFIVDLLPY